MELYGGDPPRYHMKGMIDTPRITEMLKQLATQAYLGVLGAQLVSGRLGEKGLLEHVLAMRKRMEARYPGIAPDPKAAIAALKKRRN